MEIVTEPDLSSADEAYVFCTELQRLAVYLGVCEGNMQQGQMRFEPNVNVAINSDGKEYRTPISEIKNLNSFRNVRDAVAYEVRRQVAAWQEDHEYQMGKKPNENRGFNADLGVTEYQRPKEAAHDYRYFPDPDLVPVNVDDQMLDEIRAMLPELPIARRQRFVSKFGLSTKDAETIVGHRKAADLFEQVISAGADPGVFGKQFVNVWLRLANDRNARVTDLGVPAERMAELARITADGTVNKTAANRLAEVMLERTEPAAASSEVRADSPGARGTQSATRADATASTPSALQLAKELGLVQMTDSAATGAWVARAFAENEKAVQDAMTNPKKAKAAVGFLRGKVMKISGGQADPKLVGQLIEQRLAELRTSS